MSSGLLRGMPKDLAKLARRVRKLGWTVEVTRSNHVRWTAPDGWTHTSGLTPGSQRAEYVTVRAVKNKAGL